MRNFSKTLISMAAVMAVGTAMAAGAMAADMAATYADGVVTITDAASHGASNTLLVVQGVDGVYNATETTIKQIDQVDADAAFTSAVVGELADGSYEVRVGGTDGTVQSAVFTVSSAPQVEYKDFKYGDVDGDARKRITANDATCIAKYVASGASDATKNVGKEETLEDGQTKVKYGDVDGDARKRITANDATCVAKYVASGASDATKNVGNVVKVIK